LASGAVLLMLLKVTVALVHGWLKEMDSVLLLQTQLVSMNCILKGQVSRTWTRRHAVGFSIDELGYLAAIDVEIVAKHRDLHELSVKIWKVSSKFWCVTSL
jgi:hypothetical protein